MRNCLILGSGRSGTSLAAGMLARSGYFMGERLIDATTANPKGFFEDREINRINERLLSRVMPSKPRRPLRKLFPSRPGPSQRWLGLVRPGTTIECPAEVAGRIEAQVARAPYCFKDPRFSYTLPAWRPYLRDAVFVCVFREPTKTLESILRDTRTAPYLHDLRMSARRALRIWMTMYQHILEIHRHDGEWLFVHYEQLLDGSSAPRLRSVLDAEVDEGFPDPDLRRSSGTSEVGPRARALYAELCRLAGYEIERVVTNV